MMEGACFTIVYVLVRRRLALATGFLLLLVCLSHFVRAQESAPKADGPKKSSEELERLVTVQKGEIPIILSAPHGGRRTITGVPQRKGISAKQFVTTTDTNTQRLAQSLANSLEKRWGKPYFVVAQFSRQYLDANRPSEDALESANAKPVYDAYHSALGDAVKETRERWGRGLLIDLHGQAAEKATIFRGTGNGKTCSLLLERLGPEGLMGKAGLLGLLHARGYEIFPRPRSMDKEDTRCNGGHIVRTYGASAGTGIDAVQLELGGDFRKDAMIEKTADDLAEAIEQFADAYFAEMKTEQRGKSP